MRPSGPLSALSNVGASPHPSINIHEHPSMTTRRGAGGVQHNSDSSSRHCRAGQGRAEFDVPAGPSEGSIQGIQAIGGPNDDHLPPGVEAIHERQQRGHNAVVDLVLLAAAHLQAPSNNAIDVVYMTKVKTYG